MGVVQVRGINAMEEEIAVMEAMKKTACVLMVLRVIVSQYQLVKVTSFVALPVLVSQKRGHVMATLTALIYPMNTTTAVRIFFKLKLKQNRNILIFH